MTREELREPLVLRTLATPYLKFPAMFRRLFPFSTVVMPDPATAVMERKDGQIHLIYTWKESDLDG